MRGFCHRCRKSCNVHFDPRDERGGRGVGRCDCGMAVAIKPLASPRPEPPAPATTLSAAAKFAA